VCARAILCVCVRARVVVCVHMICYGAHLAIICYDSHTHWTHTNTPHHEPNDARQNSAQVKFRFVRHDYETPESGPRHKIESNDSGDIAHALDHIIEHAWPLQFEVEE